MNAADPTVPVNHSPWNMTITGLFEVVPNVKVLDIPGMLLKLGDTAMTWLSIKYLWLAGSWSAAIGNVCSAPSGTITSVG